MGEEWQNLKIPSWRDAVGKCSKKKSVLWYLKNYVHKRRISKKYVWLWSIIENFKNLENKYNYYCFKKHENNIFKPHFNRNSVFKNKCLIFFRINLYSLL